MNSLGLKTKLIATIIGIILLLSSILAIFVISAGRYNLLEELEAKVVSIGQNLSGHSVDYILTDNKLELYQILEETKKIEPDIAYIYVINPSGDILTHTFDRSFPSGLRNLNRLESNERKEGVVFRSEIGLIKETVFPLMGGSLGEIRIGFSQEKINQKIKAFLLLLAGVTIAAITGGVALTFYLTGRILMPVKELTRVAIALGHGNFNTRVKTAGKDELGKLSETFNIMAIKLERAHEELALTQTRLIQTAKLAALGEFVTGIAHEINNPLAGILNGVRHLLNVSYLNKEEKRYLELIHKGLIRIEETMRKLLTFAYNGKIEVMDVNINLILKDILELLDFHLKKQAITLEECMARDLPVVSANPSELQQVFMNVIKNAMDAMPHGGKLIIRTSFLNGLSRRVLLEINDNGIGIRKKDLDKIFVPFFTTKEMGQGVGLGLSVSYGIIKRHGGDIIVDSNQTGTSVKIELPVKQK